MKIVSWNINGIRARLPRILEALKRWQPDVVCLQETKVTNEAFPEEELKEAGWYIAKHGQKGFNGVAILSREPLTDITNSFPNDNQAHDTRVISGYYKGIHIINCYIVNGQNTESKMYPIKLEWLTRFTKWLQTLPEDEPRIILGDYNICPRDEDVYNIKNWRNKVPCTEPEREHYRQLCQLGYEDLYLKLHNDQTHFTWWHYRYGGFQKNQGMRIDMMLTNKQLTKQAQNITVDIDERKPDENNPCKPSDHAPLIAVFDN